MSKYSVRFTGKYINKDENQALENLTEALSSVDSEKLTALVKAKGYIKNEVSLVIANKLKTKIEMSGVECFIVASEENNDADISESKEKYSENVREGVLLISIAVCMSFVLIVFSDGYYSGQPFLYSFIENMTLYSEWVFCEDDYLDRCNSGYHVRISTKMAILVPIAIALYGVGRLLGFFKPLNYFFGNKKA